MSRLGFLKIFCPYYITNIYLMDYIGDWNVIVVYLKTTGIMAIFNVNMCK